MCGTEDSGVRRGSHWDSAKTVRVNSLPVACRPINWCRQFSHLNDSAQQKFWSGRCNILKRKYSLLSPLAGSVFALQRISDRVYRIFPRFCGVPGLVQVPHPPFSSPLSNSAFLVPAPAPMRGRRLRSGRPQQHDRTCQNVT